MFGMRKFHLRHILHQKQFKGELIVDGGKRKGKKSSNLK